MKNIVSIAAAALMTLAFAGTAAADPAFTTNRPQVGGTVKYGIYTGDADVNPYGLGLSVNGGYTLDMGLFVGGTFDYFLGDSHEADVPLVGKIETSVNVYQFMGVVGYDIGVSPEFVIRPQAGIGLTWLSGEGCFAGQCQSESENEFAIAPGVKALYSVTENVYLAADLSYNKVFADGDADGVVFGIGAGGVF